MLYLRGRDAPQVIFHMVNPERQEGMKVRLMLRPPRTMEIEGNVDQVRRPSEYKRIFLEE